VIFPSSYGRPLTLPEMAQYVPLYYCDRKRAARQ